VVPQKVVKRGLAMKETLGGKKEKLSGTMERYLSRGKKELTLFYYEKRSKEKKP